jgi:hypothetical protein
MTTNISSPATADAVPWYRKQAERPKTTRSFRIFTTFNKILENDHKDNASAFMRYLTDCYVSSKLATDVGFRQWLSNKENF